MQDLTEQQKKRLKLLAEIETSGLDALPDKIFEIEDELVRIESEKKGEKGDKGDKGERGDNGSDGKDGADGKNGRDGKDGRDGRDGADGKDGIDGKDGENGLDGSPDTPDEVVVKINQSTQKIKQERIEGIEELRKIPEIERKQREFALPQTTSFINGRRAKNINFTGASVSYGDDTATVNITTGGLSEVAHDSTLTGDGTAGNPLSVVPTISGYTIEDPTGTIDGSNTSFIVSVTPVFIVSDGIILFEGFGYSLSTLTLTLDNAPNQFLKSFHQ